MILKSKIGFNTSIIKNELKPLCYHEGVTVRSYQQFFRLYYFICLLRYSTQPQLRRLKFSGVTKVATKEMLTKLVDFGHISLTGKNNDVYIPNELTYKIVKSVKYNESNYFKIFGNLPKGIEASNDIKNTDVFVNEILNKYYYFLLFPDFTYIIPDALLVSKNGNSYKLTFLEIETKQSNTAERIERMKYNYNKLSKDIIVYQYWQGIAPLLDLPIPNIHNFKFSYSIKFL